MNVNTKGVTGLIKVIDDLQEQGFYVFPAFDDHSPIDLVAVDEYGLCYRIQVKYRSLERDRYMLTAQSVVNGVRVDIDRDLIDGWAVYGKEHKKIFYIDKILLEGKKSLTIHPEKDYGKLSSWELPCFAKAKEP